MSWALHWQLVGSSCTCWISCRFFRAVFQTFLEGWAFLSCQALCKGAIAQLAWGNHSRRGHLCSHRCKNRRNGTETSWRVLKNVLNNHTGNIRTYQDLSGWIESWDDGSDSPAVWSQMKSVPVCPRSNSSKHQMMWPPKRVVCRRPSFFGRFPGRDWVAHWSN